jgi:ubiquinone/menaquinone biosynthesis C-methylase UbiE
MGARRLDTRRAEQFSERVLGIINDGMLSLMISVGHRVRLFDVMATLPPSSSEAIAGAASLNERYVREWLGAMVVGGIVEYDPEGHRYVLPAEHAGALTRAAGTDNLAVQAQYVPLLAGVEKQIVACFENGGGVPYSEFGDFQRLMAEESAQVLDAVLFESMLPLMDGMVGKLNTGIDVADVGCGSGHAINLMAERFPRSRFIGYDFSEEGIAAARAESSARGIGNAGFEVMDAAKLGGPARFDFITTFDAIHDQAHPDRVLEGIAAMLHPGGTYLCVDIAASSRLEENMAHPLGPLLYTVSCMHCMTVSLAYDGEGLGAVWGEQKALEMMRAAGFTDTKVKRVEGDVLNNYYVATKPA